MYVIKIGAAVLHTTPDYATAQKLHGGLSAEVGATLYSAVDVQDKIALHTQLVQQVAVMKQNGSRFCDMFGPQIEALKQSIIASVGIE